MKVFVALTIVVVMLVIILVAAKKGRITVGAAKARTLEEKLAILEECGLRLAPPFTVSDLLKSFDRKEFEEDGFDATLVGLGMSEEQEPWRSHCINLWHFDTECIEGDGAYRRITERMAEMAQGSLPLRDINDCVDIEGERAWVSFSFKGQTVKIDCEVQDDWVDTKVFGRFAELLRESEPSKLYVYYGLGGQDCIIGCVTKKELDRLNRYGVKFEPLR